MTCNGLSPLDLLTNSNVNHLLSEKNSDQKRRCSRLNTQFNGIENTAMPAMTAVFF